MPYLYYVHHIDADGHGFDLFVSADTPTAARDFWRGYYADAAMREPTRIDLVPVGAASGAIPWDRVATVWPVPLTETDYEEAATAEGWTGPHSDEHGVAFFSNETEPYRTGTDKPGTWACASWSQLCAAFDIEPEPKP